MEKDFPIPNLTNAENVAKYLEKKAKNREAEILVNRIRKDKKSPSLVAYYIDKNGEKYEVNLFGSYDKIFPFIRLEVLGEDRDQEKIIFNEIEKKLLDLN